MSFRACTEMSDTKFVTTRAKRRCGETPGQGQKNDIQADRQNAHGKGQRERSYTVTSRETVLTVSAQIDSVCRFIFREHPP